MCVTDAHDINIQEIGFISGLPHGCAAMAIIGGSILADFLRNRNLLSVSNVGKIFRITLKQIIRENFHFRGKLLALFG